MGVLRQQRTSDQGGQKCGFFWKNPGGLCFFGFFQKNVEKTLKWCFFSGFFVFFQVFLHFILVFSGFFMLYPYNVISNQENLWKNIDTWDN